MRVNATRLDLAGLITCILGPASATTTCVLLHGFGAPGDDLVGLAAGLAGGVEFAAGGAGRLPGGTDAAVRFVVPEAPLELGGLYGDSRAWWMIDLARLEDDLRRGTLRDRRNEVPDGLPGARAQVLRLIDELQARFSIAAGQLVLGGFSQGAMLALDVALHRDAPPAGLLLMSGTIVSEAEWQPRMRSLAGVPVVLSHGRNDGLLPFRVAETLRDQLTAAGAIVDWQPFSGGHEIAGNVLDAAGRLLRAVGR